MKQIVAILAIVMVLAGCSEDKATGPSPPHLTITYVSDAHTTWAGCGYGTSRGHGTVKNVGGKDAIDCYVRMDPGREDAYAVWVSPRSLAPGQFGEYDTANFEETHGWTKETADCGGCE